MVVVNYGVLSIFLLGVVWSDLTRRKVFNEWVMLFFAMGLGIRQVSFLYPFVILLGIGFLLFLLGIFSAGDVKVMAMIVGYLGMEQGLKSLFWGFVVGSIWALYLGIRYDNLREKIQYFFAYIRQIFQTKRLVAYEPGEIKQKETIPLAACFAIGVFTTSL